MTFADRLARRLRPVFFALAIPALPVFLISYYYMIRLAYEALPGLLFAGLIVAHVIVWLAASTLHDFQQERRSSPPPDRQVPPASRIPADRP